MGSGIGKRAMESSLSALQRIQRLEGLMALLNEDRMKFIEAVNGAIAQQAEKTSTLEGVVNAIVDVLDKTTSSLVKAGTLPSTPTVLEVLKAHIAIRRAAQIERDKAAIAALIETGSLAVTDTIAEDSLIVGEESLVEASPDSKGPGWVQMEFSNIMPDFQPLLVGKHVGESVQLGNHMLAVQEIYKIVPKIDASTANHGVAEGNNAQITPRDMVAPAPFAEAPSSTIDIVGDPVSPDASEVA